MLSYMVKRVLFMIPTLAIISVITFVIIQLPPGDFLTTYVAQLRMEGEDIDAEEIAALEQRYGLGQPIYVQYYKWITGILFRGDWGQSMEWQKPVRELIGERMALTVVLSASTMLFPGWCPSRGGLLATHQYAGGLFPDFSFWGGDRGSDRLLVMWFAMSQLNMNVGACSPSSNPGPLVVGQDRDMPSI